MAGKETKLTVWALDPEISLNQLPELMRLNYSKAISYLDEKDLPQIDKTLMHRWKEYISDEEFNIQSYEVLGQTILSIPVRAFIETAAPPDKALHGDFVMPRSKRVTPSLLEVFFFEMSSRVYAIINGPEYKTRYIRTLLMGGGKNPEETHKEWKKVQFKDIPNYTFSSKFFYWLISKENTTITTPLFEMNISDIRLLSQSPDRRDVKHESEGDNLLEEAMSKTGLGVNSRIGHIGTTISCEEGSLRFVLFETGDCFVDNYESALNGHQGELIPFEQAIDKGSLMLYSVILPSLKAAFNADRDWTTQQQADARKTFSLGAINELCAENEISLDEIKSLDWFK